MMSTNCVVRCNCSLWALIVSVIVGVVTAFLQINGTITVAPVFLWVVFGIAVVYLAVLVVTAALADVPEGCGCVCTILNALLAGLLGTIFFALVLLAVGIVATSILSALLVGLLLLFFSLALTNTACLVRCLTDCET